MIAADAQTVAVDLHLGMAVAEMPGEPHEIRARRRSNLDQLLGFAGHAHQRAILEHQAVAVAQRVGRGRSSR